MSVLPLEDYIQFLKVKPADVDALLSVSKITFVETFAQYNTEANMQDYINKNFTETKLLQEINYTNSIFYLLKLNNADAGYIKLNFGAAQTELKQGNSMEIERIYVVKELHGKRLGEKLLLKAFDIAKEKEMDFIWLGVWEHNAKAISFYAKHGFVAFNKHTFWLGDDEQTDVLMKKDIKQTTPKN